MKTIEQAAAMVRTRLCRQFHRRVAAAWPIALIAAFAVSGAEDVVAAEASGKPALRVQCDPAKACVRFLSWDTEDGRRAGTNLLRPEQGCRLLVSRGGKWIASTELPAKFAASSAAETTYRIRLGAGSEIVWRIAAEDNRLSMRIAAAGAELPEPVRLSIAFDPRVTPTTVLPKSWNDDGRLGLPAVISAPDFGQMRLTAEGARSLDARLDGSRADKRVELILSIRLPPPGSEVALRLAPVVLPPPAGLVDQTLWRAARRGWFGAWQPTAQWGEQNRPFSSPPGLLANNVISDPASCSLWFYADQTLFVSQIAPEVSVAPLLRRTIDWWLDHRTRATGEVVCYWDFGNFLDANAGPIIAAWDYVESTGDRAWAGRRIERLEFIADFLARRDVDGDGLVEAVQSGNRGTLKMPGRSCAWWDALNCGHKDGYTNAVIYRAWRCLADLESQLGRSAQAGRYRGLAAKLKSAYAKTLLNPKTGWLAWWKSADGELHDYAAPTVNGMAVEYGLVPPEQGREILERFWAKVEQVGFKRFDLGVPPMLVPVRRSDYLLPDALGIPQREDGTDTLGHYQNGGVTAGHVLHFLAAHYVVGRPEKADRLLRAMLARQAEGKFQNGVRDAGGQGIDWTDWNGNPTGYEGYLADSFRFLEAVLLREAPFRQRYYRPLRD